MGWTCATMGNCMSFDVRIRYSGGVAILDLTGRLTGGYEGDALRDTLLACFNRGRNYLLLHCEGLSFVDSGGLGELVSSYATIVRRGGTIRLLRPSRRLSDLLTLTRTDSLFEVESDEAAAVAGFRSAAAAKTQEKLSDFLATED